MKKQHPGLKFFIKKGDEFMQVPRDITGIHMLSKYLLNRFVSSHACPTTDDGKFAFLQAVLNQEVNKHFTPEAAIVPLSLVITESFDIRKKSMDHPMNARDEKHVAYGIKKELETILINRGIIQKKDGEKMDSKW